MLNFKQLETQKLLSLPIIMVVVLSIFYLWQEKNIITVRITNDGFIPESINIKKGERVKFLNETGREVWPASDSHPSHSLYREFDPKQPIEPDGEWTFQFNLLGVWNYHDHLKPDLYGVVMVGDNYELVTVNKEECLSLTEVGEKKVCWDKLLKESYYRGGLESGFDLFSEFYDLDPDFVNNCHDNTHTLGRLAYQEYREGEDFYISEQVGYCSYGFFHGFIEMLMAETGSYAGAREFCDYLDHVSAESELIYPCLHGIGHGVTDGSDPRFYGQARAMVEPSLEMCRAVGNTDFEYKICATGVFDSIAGFMARYENGLEPNYDNPYELCLGFADVVTRSACYDDFKSLVYFVIAKNDFVKAVDIVMSIDELTPVVAVAMENLALMITPDLINQERSIIDSTIATCQSLMRSEIKTACLNGIAVGMLNVGTPGQEYLEAINFCNNKLLSPGERSLCLLDVFETANKRYSNATFSLACEYAKKEFRNYISACSAL